MDVQRGKDASRGLGTQENSWMAARAKQKFGKEETEKKSYKKTVQPQYGKPYTEKKIFLFQYTISLINLSD